ncbi:MAG: protoheme IX farnesyltransferase [SAR202 cluster bacterium Io17-Chloro-G9]|nr:MAG: protoheme IX farnesyltransferase [SAR202 cluster bacterium Io17-Chloro-G9]
MLDLRPLAAPNLARLSGAAKVANDYLTLTKPPIILLLVITAIGGMFLAAQGVPSLKIVILVCLGGSLGAGGANALNHYMDRDIDQIMSRTWQRPVASQRISRRHALAFGILLNLLAFMVLALWVNLLAATLTLAATLFYVLVYTNWLKRTTHHNIVIGGAAGAIPPLVGWAGVTGGLDLPALYLFAIVFFWTPPHFWALSLLIQEDYRRAGIPMLPVVAGVEYTVLNIFLYSLVLVALALLLAVTPAAGGVYLTAAAVLGAAFVALAWRLKIDPSKRRARHLYLYSLLYLALLFVAMITDTTLG